MTGKRLRIAVVGAGVAGIGAAHVLQRSHDVVLYEKNDYVGGHTNTIVIEDGPDAGTAVDTGFIVLNDRTYPTLRAFLAQLGVATRDSDMSFGYHCEETGLQYAGTSLDGLFAQRRNIANPWFLHLCTETLRFHRRALRDLDAGLDDSESLAGYLKRGRFSRYFVDHYVVPMGAAIWSTPPRGMLRFPAVTFLRFLKNHGLLSVTDYPQWMTVEGGSFQYLRAFLREFRGTAVTGARIRHVERTEAGAVVRFSDAPDESFDRVVMAAHADESLRLLADPTPLESKLLGAWSYEPNNAVLHTDETVLAPNPRAWASWNYRRALGSGDDVPMTMTYDMNRLQGLRTAEHYCVTINPSHPIAPRRIIREIAYTHPQYSRASLASQRRLAELQGVRNTYFCGSYFGYGFHEDAIKSGVDVARLFGLEL